MLCFFGDVFQRNICSFCAFIQFLGSSFRKLVCNFCICLDDFFIPLIIHDTWGAFFDLKSLVDKAFYTIQKNFSRMFHIWDLSSDKYLSYYIYIAKFWVKVIWVSYIYYSLLNINLQIFSSSGENFRESNTGKLSNKSYLMIS